MVAGEAAAVAGAAVAARSARQTARLSGSVTERCGKLALSSLLVLLATLIVYAQVAGHEFVSFDTPDYIHENPVVQRGLTWDGIGWAFTTTTAANWHPVTWLSIMLDCELFGLDAGSHHLMNVALHGLNALLILLLLSRLTSKLIPATCVALLFAVHPQHVESVAWAAERKDVLSTLFTLLATITYVAHRQRPSVLRIGTSLLCYGIALMAKPMPVSLPFLLLLLDGWPLGRFGTVPWSRLLLEKLPYLVLAMAGAASTVWAQSAEGAVGTVTSYPLTGRMANAAVSTVAYILQTLWPHPLCVLYPYPEHIPIWQWTGAGILLLAISGVVVRYRREAPYGLFGWAWWCIALGPVIGIVQVGTQSRADRYTYLPHIGLFVAVVWALAALHQRARPGVRKGLIAVACLAMIGLTARAFRQVATWRNSDTLHLHALAVTDRNAKMAFNYGVTLTEAGNPEKGVGYLQRAAEFDPDFPRVHYTLGVVLSRLGRANEARAAFEAAVRRTPQDEDAQSNLAAIHFHRGNYRRALVHFSAAVEAAPQSQQAWNNLIATWTRLGETLLKEGKRAEAATLFRKVLQRSPDNAHVRGLLRKASDG